MATAAVARPEVRYHESDVRVVSRNGRQIDRVGEAHVHVGSDAHTVVNDEVRAEFVRLLE